MEKEKMLKIFNDFCVGYNFKKDKLTWKNQSEEFRQFWHEKIMDDNYHELSEDDMDYVIRFFCNRAKGAGEFKDNGGQAAAFTDIRRPYWYKALRSLKNKKNIREKLNQIFTTEDENQRIILVNELKQINRENRNCLTTAKAIVLNAFLFVFNPDKYLMTFSMAGRFALIDFLKFGDPRQYKTYGERVIKTNSDIVSGFKQKYEVDIKEKYPESAPIALDSFIYNSLRANYDCFEKIDYWKEEMNRI